MAVDAYSHTYPLAVLEESYKPKDAEGIVAGMMVKVDTNNELVKCDGTAGEYCMLAMNDQPTNFMEQSQKISCVKGSNGAFRTDQFKAGITPTYHQTLQVSAVGGEEGLLTVHGGGGAPIAGRFVGWSTEFDTTFLIFDFVRS